MRAVAVDRTGTMCQPRALVRRSGLLALVLLGLGGCGSQGTVPSYVAIGSLPKPAPAKAHVTAPHAIDTTGSVPKPQPMLGPASPVAIPDMPALRPTLSSFARPWSASPAADVIDV